MCIIIFLPRRRRDLSTGRRPRRVQSLVNAGRASQLLLLLLLLTPMF